MDFFRRAICSMRAFSSFGGTPVQSSVTLHDLAKWPMHVLCRVSEHRIPTMGAPAHSSSHHSGTPEPWPVLNLACRHLHRQAAARAVRRAGSCACPAARCCILVSTRWQGERACSLVVSMPAQLYLPLIGPNWRKNAGSTMRKYAARVGMCANEKPSIVPTLWPPLFVIVPSFDSSAITEP